MQNWISKENEDRIGSVRKEKIPFENVSYYIAYLKDGFKFDYSNSHTLCCEDEQTFKANLNKISMCECFECKYGNPFEV